MEIGERERQLQQLAGFDPAAADLDELRQALRVINTTSGWLHTLKVGAKRRLEQLEAANQPSPTNPAAGSGGGVDGLGGSVGEEMINCGGKSNADANATYEHDRVFSDFNGLEQLVADGKVSIDHVNALARLTKKLTDTERSELQLHRDDILAAAVREYLGAFARYIKRLLAQIREANEEADAVARLERQVAATNIRQWTDDSSGMYHAHLEMDPIRGAQFRTAVDREYRRLRQLPENKDRDHDQVMADAIIAATTNPNSPGLPEINIIITADHLTKHTNTNNNNGTTTKGGSTTGGRATDNPSTDDPNTDSANGIMTIDHGDATTGGHDTTTSNNDGDGATSNDLDDSIACDRGATSPNDGGGAVSGGLDATVTHGQPADTGPAINCDRPAGPGSRGTANRDRVTANGSDADASGAINDDLGNETPANSDPATDQPDSRDQPDEPPAGDQDPSADPDNPPPNPNVRSCCETLNGQPLPVTTVERLCCEAIIYPILVDPDGRTVDQLGEPIRTANRQQRRALAALYATCAHPHCNVPFDRCRIHHIIWYSRGGKTILINLAPVCEPHHHLVHEGGWSLALDPTTRQLDWHRPNGTIAYTTHPDRLTNTTNTPTTNWSTPAPATQPADTYQQPQLC